jgi:hypothetical protein
MIYAVQILKTQFVKIGFSQNSEVKKRIAELQTGCPFEITSLFSIEGSLIQEQEVHAALNKAFAQIRVPIPPNEWYPGRHPWFQRFLNELKFGANVGLAFCDEYNYHGVNKGSRPGSATRDYWKPNFKWPVKAEFTEQRVFGSKSDKRSESPPVLGTAARQSRPIADEANLLRGKRTGQAALQAHRATPPQPNSPRIASLL